MAAKRRRPRPKPPRRLRGVGAALITGGAGDDPAGVMTYTVIGATAGLSQLWLLVLSTPMLVATTAMASTIARTSREGLAAVIARRYGRTPCLVIVLLLALANVATIAADSAGVAGVLQMVTGVHWMYFQPLLVGLLLLVLRLGYGRVKQILTALTVFLALYAVAAVLARPDWIAVARATVVPAIVAEHSWLIAALGLLGTTISPYMLFWQADEEAEEILRGDGDASPGGGTAAMWVGMIYSNLVAFFIVVAAAATIHAGGGDMTTLADAARALSPLGEVGDDIFILSMIASGLLALPVLAGSTAYAVAEAFGWKHGLGARAAEERGFYVVLVGALVGGVLISLIPDFEPPQALFYSQVFDGVLLPLNVLVLLMLSNDPRVVGRQRNPRWVNAVGVVTIVAVLAADFAALVG